MNEIHATESRAQNPGDQEIELRLATVRVGIWLTLIVCSGVGLEAIMTWGQPHRLVIIAAVLIGALSALVVAALPTDEIVRGRWREPFFVAWSAADIVLIAILVTADGGVHSPFTLLFVLPLLFGTLSYPLVLAMLVGAGVVGAFLTVAIATGGDFVDGAFGAFALVCAAGLSSWEARNQARRREALAQTAGALRASDAMTRIQARQQEEVARIGQMALGGDDIEDLLQEALGIVRGVLGVDIAAVLKLLPEEGAFVFRAASGLPENAVQEERLSTGANSQSGYTLATGAPVIVRDWALEDRFSKPHVLVGRGIACGLTVLIQAKGEPYGVLGVQSTRRLDFKAEDVNFLQSVANVIANAIERRNAEERTRHEALHDPLTGLPNRKMFLDRLQQALARAPRLASSVGVLFLGLDQFKLVNDSLGHNVGDELLAAIAPRLEQTLRPGDVAARFGGDEFAFLVENVFDERDVTKVAERIQEAFAEPFLVRLRKHFVTVSLGISIGTGPEAPEDLIRDADSALYQAKEQGRGCTEVFDKDMRARLVEHVQTEADLRGALERNELELHFQPVVSLHDGAITSLESLLRWRHPERGLLSPAAFIPVAEDSRLILPIGRWVIEESCRRAASWQAIYPDSAPIGVAVNLSVHQLEDPELLSIVQGALERAGIQPSSLSLELTESVFLDDAELPNHLLASLRALGVRLVLDDFGTGFSSLGYLRRMRLDGIKLDRTFIENVAEGRTDAAIVRAVFEMARALDLEVVAEGVETGDQLSAVRALGCREAQGFYFTRPVPAREIEGMLRELPWGGGSAFEAADLLPDSSHRGETG